MPIPDYQECMLPVLDAIADGAEHHIRDVTKVVADHFCLSDDERTVQLPSGQQSVIANRVAWAKTYLKNAGLLENTRRGVVRISASGKSVLVKRPQRIDTAFLRQFEGLSEFLKKSRPAMASGESTTVNATPEEALEESYSALRNALAVDLIDRVKSCSPQFFERLVVELLVAMGYGGSLVDAGKAIGRSGDGGIDGIIKEDKLGLDVVCIQAKRWDRTVGRPEVQAFVGSMEGLRARKGVLITTASFSKEAEDFVTRIERKIVLIDGKQLAQLMIDHDVGVAVARTFSVKRMDLDYFEEEDS